MNILFGWPDEASFYLQVKGGGCKINQIIITTKLQNALNKEFSLLRNLHVSYASFEMHWVYFQSEEINVVGCHLVKV